MGVRGSRFGFVDSPFNLTNQKGVTMFFSKNEKHEDLKKSCKLIREKTEKIKKLIMKDEKEEPSLKEGKVFKQWTGGLDGIQY